MPQSAALLRCARSASAALAAVLASALAPPAAAGSELAWRWARAFEAAGEARAVAFDPRSGRVALGGREGVRLGRPRGRARRVLRRGPVRDLAFDAEGGLLAATDRGVFRRGPEGRVAERSPGPGKEARRVTRLHLAEGLTFAGTGDGVYVGARPEGGGALGWRRADAGLPGRRVDALAILGAAGGRTLFALLEGALYRARLSADGAATAGLRDARRVDLPRAGDGDGPRDLARLPGGALLVLSGRTLVLLPSAGAVSDRRVHRPALPPGARPRRLAVAAGSLWLATERGLLRAPGPAGPFRRAAPPAGRAAVWDVAAGGGRVFAAGERGLLVGSPETPGAERAGPEEGRGSASTAPAAGAEPDPPRGREPAVAAVHRAALRHQGLGPEAFRELRRRVARRGWLPELELRGDYGASRDRELEVDDALRPTVTHERSRSDDRDYEVRLELSWELGDLAFNPDAIKVSREARQVIKLRDDVLGEITQLYFERRRVLRELAGLGPEPGPEARERAAELRLRADELAAGLDAWTGGWWSRRVPPLSGRDARVSPPRKGREERP